MLIKLTYPRNLVGVFCLSLVCVHVQGITASKIILSKMLILQNFSRWFCCLDFFVMPSWSLHFFGKSKKGMAGGKFKTLWDSETNTGNQFIFSESLRLS